MAKKKETAEVSGSNHEVLSTKGKIIRWICSVVLILYSFITIFVIAIKVLLEGDFPRYFLNSLILTVCGTAGCILVSSMAAYGIARYRFKGRGLLVSE